MQEIIYGRGSDSSDSSSSSGTEYPDTLRSKSYAKVIDLLGEGEFEEVLVGGLTGLYLDDVPVQNMDGSFNFTGLNVETRTGTLNQTRMTVGGTTENSESVGIELRYNIPIEQAVLAAEADMVRVNVRVPSLVSTSTEDGTVGGTTVKYKIEWKDNVSPTWNTVYDGSSVITKTSSIATGVSTATLTGYTKYTCIATVSSWTAQDALLVFSNQWITYKTASYSIQKNVNSGGWVTVKSGKVTGTSNISVDISALATDVVLLRIVKTDLGSLSPSEMKLKSGTAKFNVSGVYTEYDGVQKISGKSSSEYERQTSFRISGIAPWTVRVTRLTVDSTSAYLQNATYFSSITTVLEEKLRYPGSVLVGMQIDAEQFSSIPTRSFLCKCLKIKVPTNYDPISREYDGVWDGSFKVAWSNNPAWCFYDLITNTRYGLGERIPESYVDKAELYTIGQYCDEMVAGDDGVAEPRFTCNAVIQTREAAYQMISDFASIFRGMSYWAAGTIVPVQDSPKDPSYAFNNTNVVDGLFTYQSSKLESRYNAVTVTWNNPKNFYKREFEYVENVDLINSLGFVNETSVVAFGCTSRAMARRVGKWLIYTNNYQTDVVTFSTGLEGVIPRPGDVIKISDTIRATERRGGRIKASTLAGATLDKEMVFTLGTTYTLTAVDQDGNLVDKTFTYSGTTDTITFDVVLTTALSKDSIYIISDDNIEPQLFKVTSVADKGKQVFEISAVSHTPAKYDYVEYGESLPPLGENTGIRNPVTGITTSEYLYADGVSVKSRCDISWEVPKYAKKYLIQIRKPDGSVVSETVYSATYSLLDTMVGLHDVTITAFNILGAKSVAYSTSLTLYGKTAAPSDIAGFAVTAVSNKAYLTWDTHVDLDVRVGGFIQIMHSPKSAGAAWTDGIAIDKVVGSASSALVPLLGGTYMVKAIDSSGTFSENATFATSDYATVQNKNVVATLTENPSFSGTKTNMIVVGNQLTLQSSTMIDDAGMVDDYSLFDYLGNGVYTSGEYLFNDIIDMGSAYSVNITGHVSAYSAEVLSMIDSRTEDIDSWAFFDALVPNTATINLYVSTTNDDPNVSPIWSDWSLFRIATYSARAFKFKLVVETISSDYTVFVDELSVDVDVEDRVFGENDITCPITGMTVVFSPAFMDTPAISVAINNMQQGDYYEITSKTANGFSFIVKDTGGTPVERVVDYIAKGYGYKS